MPAIARMGGFYKGARRSPVLVGASLLANTGRHRGGGGSRASSLLQVMLARHADKKGGAACAVPPEVTELLHRGAANGRPDVLDYFSTIAVTP